MAIAAGTARPSGELAGEHRATSSSHPPRLSQSGRLHAFSFPTWGVQRLLRCCKKPGAAAPGPVGSAAPTNHRGQPTARVESRPPPGGPDPKEADRDAAEKAPPFAAAPAAIPWSLRKRRANSNTPPERYGDHGSTKSDRSVKTATAKARLTSSGAKRGETYRFSVSLSRAEIEEDFFAVNGSKPPRRPKKRPKIIQRQINAISPGLWLSDITLDAFKVAD